MGSLGKRKLFVRTFVLFVLASPALFFGVTSVIAQVSLAPVNPAFLEYLQKLQESGVQRETAEGHALGFVPPPLDLSHLTEFSVFPQDPFVGIPSTYDLRTLGKVTPIRDQGPCGSCWAFASYASLESNLLPSETWDFSENNLKNTHGYDTGPCGGGNSQIATAYLARWSGPVAEMDDPYNPSSGVSPVDLPVRKHVQEVLIVPDRASFSDNQNLKKAVIDYGAVPTTFYINDSLYFNAANNSYYYPGDPICRDAQNNPVPCTANHGVAIVGWNDQFDKNKFSPVPPGNGAFIAKNSWGASWGENGYFYVSYYDYGIGKSNWIFNGSESTENYSRTYEYDPLGWVSGVGFSGQFSAWFSNVFTAVETEELRAVSFYTASPDSIYEIYVYTDVNSDPRSGFLMGIKTGTVVLPGYHTIPLDAAVPLILGQTFSVVVNLTTPVWQWPVAIEHPISGYSGEATAGPGQSYISPDGITWYDLTSLSGCSDWNVCLKAFTVQASPSYRKVILFTPNGSEAIPSWSTYPVVWGAPPHAERFKLLYSSDGGVTWKLIAKDIPGDPTGINRYPWEVPKTGGNKKGWLIKVVGYDASGRQVVGVDKSAPFSIEVVKVISPNGGEVFHTGAGGMWDIAWSASPETDHFDLMFSMDNKLSWQYVEGGRGVTGRSFAQAIPPPSTGNRTKCFIKVIAYDTLGSQVGLDRSDAPFTVEVVKLTSPNGGGPPLKSEDLLTITWTKYNTIAPVMAIHLYLTMDGGLTWKPIATNLPGNSASYPWTVSHVKITKNQCKLRVVLKDATGVIRGSDMSDKYFTITP